MSYKEILQKQIKELEDRITQFQGDKTILEDQLQRLRLAEFEEDMRENASSEKQLLKG
jgi:hypothetical protein